MEDNKKTISLADVLAEVLGADFDAEKSKALESKLNAFIGQTTVPKSAFNDKNTKLKDLKAKLAERAEKQKDASEWKKQIADLTTDYENKLKAKDDAFNDYRLTQALKDGKAKNPKAVKALLDLTKLTFDGEDIGGLDEQLTEVKKTSDYLFDIPANEIPKGTGFPASPNQPTNEPAKPVNKVI